MNYKISGVINKEKITPKQVLNTNRAIVQEQLRLDQLSSPNFSVSRINLKGSGLFCMSFASQLSNTHQAHFLRIDFVHQHLKMKFPSIRETRCSIPTKTQIFVGDRRNTHQTKCNWSLLHTLLQIIQFASPTRIGSCPETPAGSSPSNFTPTENFFLVQRMLFSGFSVILTDNIRRRFQSTLCHDFYLALLYKKL